MKKKSVNLITAVGVLVVLSGAYVGVKAYVAKAGGRGYGKCGGRKSGNYFHSVC